MMLNSYPYQSLSLSVLVLWTIAFCLTGTPCQAADPVIRIEIPSSLNPVGSGARALGMGGAFIAVADDATAASWNPGGLIQLERPELSIVVTGFHRSEENSFSESPGSDGRETVSKANINYFSAAAPVELWGYNLTVALNYQRLYDFSREWDFPVTTEVDDGMSNIYQEHQVDYSQDGALSAIGLSCSLLITPDLSLGVTLNIWDDGLTENNWEKSIDEKGWGDYNGYRADFEVSSHEWYSFKGVNANIGFLWTLNSKMTLGGVLKTPFGADLNYRESTYTEVNYTDPVFPVDFIDESVSEEECTLNMPMSCGIGMAYRPSDALTVSMDVYGTFWDDYTLEDSQGRKTSPVTGKSHAESEIDSTVQVRVGTEYLIIKPRYLIPLRCGLFYDPAPAEGDPDNFFGATLGGGINFNRLCFDAAYQYRFGRDVGESILHEYGFSQDVDEHAIYTSIIWYF